MKQPKWTKTEERISEPEDISMETSKTEKQRKTKMGNKNTEQDIQQPWDNYKRWNICIMGIPEREEKGKEQRKYLKQ